MRRFIEYVFVIVLVVVVSTAWVGFIRWGTDGVPDCSNCDPE